MERITNKDVEHYQRKLNKALGRPLDAWDSKTRKANPGHIHSRGINGYFNIHCTCNESGGISDLACGLTKRGVYEWYKAALEGIQMYKDCKNYGVAMSLGRGLCETKTYKVLMSETHAKYYEVLASNEEEAKQRVYGWDEDEPWSLRTWDDGIVEQTEAETEEVEV